MDPAEHMRWSKKRSTRGESPPNPLTHRPKIEEELRLCSSVYLGLRDVNKSQLVDKMKEEDKLEEIRAGNNKKSAQKFMNKFKFKQVTRLIFLTKIVTEEA